MMRLIGIALLLLTSPFLIGAAPSRTQTYTAGTVIDNADVTENEDNIFSYLQSGVDTYAASSITSNAIQNGTITTSDVASETLTTSNLLDGTILNADIASSAAISDSKLAQLTTASKVSGAALTSFSSIPSGAGTIPVANLPGVQSTIIDFSRTAAAGSGAAATTGMGFQPTALLLICTDNSAGTRATWGFGDDADGETAVLNNAGNFNDDTATIVSIINGTDSMDAVLTSLDSDGFTLTWTKANSGMTVDCIALGVR